MFRSLFAGLLFTTAALAQDESMHHMHNMSEMNMSQAGAYLMNQASGTSENPDSWTMPMTMISPAGWNLMFMGQAFVMDTQETGPRGADKLASSNYGMFAAEHDIGRGSFMFEMMLSLEPATVTDRRYPELFQTGETAFGKDLVDAQHPHDFFMALGVHYAHPVGKDTILQI